MLVEFTFIVTLWLAMLGLLIDGGRFMFFRSQLIFTATSAAAAGGKQLDQQPNAVTRARDAATNIANANIGTFDGLTTASVTSIKVCASINPCTETADDAVAKYIEVSIGGLTERVFITPVELRAAATAYGG